MAVTYAQLGSMDDSEPLAADTDRPSLRTDWTWVEAGSDHLATSLDLPDSRRFPGPWPSVIVIHGFTSQRLGRVYHLVDLGRRLAAEGIACIRFDQAGCGESTGSPLGYSVTSIARDADAVHAWMKRDARFCPSCWGVLGSSMGAVGALKLDALRGSRAVALWAPIFGMAALVRARQEAAESAHVFDRYGFVPYRGLRLSPAFFEAAANVDLAREIAAGNSPVLIFHAREDGVVPFAHSEQLLDTCGRLDRECRLAPLDGESHDFHEEPERTLVLESTVAWFVEQLRRRHERGCGPSRGPGLENGPRTDGPLPPAVGL